MSVDEFSAMKGDAVRSSLPFFPFFPFLPLLFFSVLPPPRLLSCEADLAFPLQVYVNIGRGTTTDQEKLVEALQAKPSEGEAEDATGTLRIGAASLECAFLSFPLPPLSTS
jgi:hypothetical protein